MVQTRAKVPTKNETLSKKQQNIIMSQVMQKTDENKEWMDERSYFIFVRTVSSQEKKEKECIFIYKKRMRSYTTAQSICMVAMVGYPISTFTSAMKSITSTYPAFVRYTILMEFVPTRHKILISFLHFSCRSPFPTFYILVKNSKNYMCSTNCCSANKTRGKGKKTKVLICWNIISWHDQRGNL